MVGLLEQLHHWNVIGKLGVINSQETIKNTYFTGATFLLLEIVLGSIIVAIVKYVANDISVAIILMFRYIFCLPILIFFGLRLDGFSHFKIKNIKVLALRSVSGLLGLSFWYLSVIYLAISKALALGQIMPIFICLLSIMFLGERVGIYRWSAIIFGLIGALVIIDPGTDGWKNIGFLYIFLGTLSASIMFVSLRQLGLTENPIAAAFWYNTFGAMVFTIYCSSFLSLGSISKNIWLILLIIGILASAQQIFMALSHKYASASGLAPIHYANIPIGVFIGVLVFNETISFNFIFGTALIVGATLFIIYREKI